MKKRFKQRDLIELISKMSVDQAKKLLKLEKYGDLKKAYRKASTKYHPDRQGGDTEAMKEVNEAYELLKEEGTKKTDRKNTIRENVKKAKIVKNIMSKAFDPEKYAKYFSKLAGKPVRYSEDIKKKNNPPAVDFTYEFYTENRETVFYVNLYVSLDEVDFKSALGGGTPTVNLSFSTDNYLYHNKRKHKLKQRTWDFKSSTDDIIDPKKIFPANVLKKIFSGKKVLKFTKKDFEEGLIRELKSSIDEGKAKIPLPNNTILLLYRDTFGGQSTWKAAGIFKQTKRLTDTAIPETEDALGFIVSLVNEMRKKKDTKSQAIVYNKNVTYDNIEQYYPNDDEDYTE